MKIYLDNCVLQRPLDDKSQTKIRLEAEATLSIFEECRSGEVELVSSETLEFDIEQTSLKIRREYADAALQIATITVTVNDEIKSRANTFVNLRIKPIDALHLASAEEAEVDYFCTCDDRFYRRAKSVYEL